MQKNKEKKQKDPALGFIGYSVSIVMSVIAVVYLGYHFINSFGTELSTEYALQVTESDVMEFDAYILRSEFPISSTVTGGIGYNYPDGTKVRAGTEVASIYGGAVTHSSDTRDEIIKLDDKIELLSESNDIRGLAASDTSTLDNRIDEYYMTIRKNAEEGAYDNLLKRRDELLTLLNKRQVITGRVDNFDSVIQDLKAEREILTASLDNVSENVITPHAGFFYSSLDGYESVFTSAMAESMTLSDFDRMIDSEPVTYPQTVIGKITTDFTWYIAIETTRDELRYYNQGYSYRVGFPYNNDIELTMKLDRIVAPDGETRILLLFSCSNVPEDFSFRRMQPVEIVRSSFTGYKVPISAVRLLDGKMGVYILVGNTVNFKYIDVMLESDGYYIVSPQDPENDPEYYTKLGLYDLIITAGKNLAIGKMIS